MKSHEPYRHNTPDHGRVFTPPIVGGDEFEAFGLWMNVQLSQLVARWKHLAAPRARRVEQLLQSRFSKPRKPK